MGANLTMSGSEAQPASPQERQKTRCDTCAFDGCPRAGVLPKAASQGAKDKTSDSVGRTSSLVLKTGLIVGFTLTREPVVSS